ncbi:unnamed protein product [Larinioides sclopetarius]|uniref:DNA-directed RNA polymerase III subunit RPC4 n=1 Tax=Larinioides sclopetarius TaxID=280406 RepID=A0AAV2AN65_9ARAC
MSQQPEDKKPDFSNFPRGAIGIKGLPVGRNARLPSIRTPRDLTLGSQPKRTFTPNIPVRREKKPTDITKGGGESSSETPSNRNRNTTPKSERGRGRGRGKGQIIQLEGSVFGEGIAQSAYKASSSRQRESIPRSEFSSGRPFVKKEKTDYDVHHMEQEMKMLLRDDFIDDGDDSNSADESMKPVIFPAKVVKEKQEKTENDEKAEGFQNQDFAKTMGFDVEKIARFIKKEKLDEPKPVVAQPDWSKIPKNEITEVLTSKKGSNYTSLNARRNYWKATSLKRWSCSIDDWFLAILY